MANLKISQLPSLQLPASTAVVPVVSGGTTYQVSLAEIVAAGIAVATGTVLGAVKIGAGLTVDANGLLESTSGSLDGLSDTTLTVLADSDLLAYSSGKWINTDTLDAGEV